MYREISEMKRINFLYCVIGALALAGCNNEPDVPEQTQICMEHARSTADNPKGFEFFRFKITDAPAEYYPDTSIVYLQGEFKEVPMIFGCWMKNGSNEITGDRLYDPTEINYLQHKGKNWSGWTAID